jgi:hypothetical protein
LKSSFFSSAQEKERLLLPIFLELTGHHQKFCPPYAAMLDALGFRPENCGGLSELPFLPVGLFK